MNTVAKGNLFEEKCHEIIKKTIEDGSLGIKDNIKIFRKKPYYSNSRKKEIKFDLTIEVWPPGAERYALIYIIECKDYADTIPVDDIEVFYTQAMGVAEGCFKCVFITNNGYQEGTRNFAETKRIMLIRAEEGNNYNIILHKKNINNWSIPKIVLSEISSSEDIGVTLIEKIIDKAIEDSFKDSQTDKPLFVDMSYLSKRDIDKIVKNELNKIDTSILQTGIGLNQTVIKKHITETLKLKLEFLNEDSNLLGSCDIQNKTILIHPSLIGTKRYLFVLAHELGHYVLHKNIKVSQTTYNNFIDSEINFKTNRYELSNPKHWLEWQANYFSSSIILPDVLLVARLIAFQNKNNLRNGKLFLDDQLENRQLFNKAIENLSYIFDVTKTTIIYRLKDLNMLEDKSRLKRIGELMAEFNSDLF